MDTKLKWGLILGSGIIAIGALFTLNKQKQQKSVRIPDNVLKQFLQDLRSQCFPHFFLVATIMTRMKNDIQSQAEFENVRLRVLPEVEILFNKKQAMVLTKYDHTLEEMLYSIQESDNQEIKQLHKDFTMLYEQSLEGINPKIDLSPETIDRFKPKQIIKIVEEVLKVSIETIAQSVISINEECGLTVPIALDQPIFMKKLHQFQLVPKKRAIYVKHKIADYETEPQSPTEVFSKLTQYNKTKDSAFNLALTEVEDQFEKIIGQLMRREINASEALESVEQIHVEDIVNKYL